MVLDAELSAGMFDEWAYAYVPSGAPAVSLPVPSSAKSPPENKQVIQTSKDVPLPILRRRSSSTSAPTTSDPAKFSGCNEWPGSKPSVLEWLGEYSPRPFDTQFFDAKTAHQARSIWKIKAAARLCSLHAVEAEKLASEANGLRGAFQNLSDKAKSLNSVDYLQDDASTLLSELKDVIAIYDGLDDSVAFLSRPAPRIAKDKRLPEVIATLKAGIQWFSTHTNVRDADLYEMRFRQSLERALKVAKSSVVHVIRSEAAKLQPRIEKTQSEGAKGALVWTKWEQDLEGQAWLVSFVSEDNKLIQDLRAEYFSRREALLSPIVATYALGIDVNDIIGSLRTVLVHLKDVYGHERRLYASLFGSESPELSQWLVDLGEALYLPVRQYIFKEQDIAQLCSLLVLLQGLDDPLFNGVERDTQRRIVFRCERQLEKFLSYKITAKDFNRAEFSPISDALELLRQVYQLLDPSVFNEMGHRFLQEILTYLQRSVDTTDSVPELKRRIFHVQQLLSLQSRIVEFDLETYVEPEIDFSGLTQLGKLLSRDISFRQALDLAYNSVPRVVECLFDAMELLYAHMRKAVEKLTEAFVYDVCSLLKGDPLEASRSLRDRVSVEVTSVKPALEAAHTDSRIAGVLLDSIQEAVVRRYAEWHVNNSGEGVMDPEALAAWMGALSI